MSKELPFNNNAEYLAMKKDIADRSFNLKLKGGLITIGLLAVAAAALFLTPLSFGVAAPYIGAIAAMASGVAGFATLKESENLKLDREYLETRIQGGNWWGGYREQVLDRGGQNITTPFVGMPLHDQAKQRG